MAYLWHKFSGMVGIARGDSELTQTDVDYLSEPYVAHELVGLIEHK